MATDIIARGMITEYKSGTNISFKENDDGSVTISASGDVSSEDTVARETIDNHKLDKNNPHNVTAEQVGLGNVDNTADLDKPISTAVQTALDDKANSKHTHNKSDITDFPNSLPANGGNADTVNGFGVAEYVTTLPEGEYYTEVARINTRGKKIESCDTSNLKVGLADYATNADYAMNSNTVNNHTVDSDVPANAVFTDTTNSDVQASGNPVQIDGLQGGVPFSEMVVSGKNLMPFPYYDGNSKTHNGITFTVNSDGTVTANGTATDIAYFYIAMYAKIVKKGVRYAISGCPEGANVDTYRIYINERKSDSTSNGIFIADFNDNKSFTVSDNCDSINIAIQIRSGVTVDNLVFRPQLELGDTATAYKPPITGRELTVNVCGKNLISGNIINKTGTVTDNSDSWIIEWTAAMYVRFDKIFLKPNTDYTISWWQKSDNGTDCVKIGVINGDDKSPIIEQSSAEIKTGAEYTLCSFTFNSGNNRNIYVQFLRASATGTVYVKKSIQLELGDTATAYEPYHGSTTTITPDSNPYTVPNDIRQQEGLNVVSVSEGELSVTGVRKNAAVKKIWDDMGMDLLFDGVTDENNPALIDIKDYSIIVVSVASKYSDDIINTGTIIMAVSDIIKSISAGIKRYFSTGSRAAIINITGTINNCAIVFAPHNTGDTILNCKIYGVK